MLVICPWAVLHCRHSVWDDLAVPSSWEMRGHGRPIYTNIHFPFKAAPPLIEHSLNHVGSYEKEFRIPKHWFSHDGQCRRRIFLCLEGVSSACKVWLDGVFVGYSQDSRLPAEFELTHALLERDSGVHISHTHTLCVQVFRFCDGSYLEDQDQWWLSGIHRHVYLYAKPHNGFIFDYSFATDLIPNSSVLSQMEDYGFHANSGVKGSDFSIDLDVTVVIGSSRAAKRHTYSNAHDNSVIVDATHVDFSSLNSKLLVDQSDRFSKHERDSSIMFGNEASAAGSSYSERPIISVTAALYGPYLFQSTDDAFPADAPCVWKRVLTPAEWVPQGGGGGGGGGGGSQGGGGSEIWRARIEDEEVHDVRAWNAESPFLYRLVLSSTTQPHGGDGDDETEHAASFDCEAAYVGFRQVKIEGNKLLVNNKAISIRGVNRHEHHEEHGKTLTFESMAQDIMLMKQFNFNSVRTSHYPNCPEFYDLCSAFGLYVCDEANIEVLKRYTHAALNPKP
jgi:hypothetical protein